MSDRVLSGDERDYAAADEIPPAPAGVLAENKEWHGPRCICGLPAYRSLLDTPERRAWVHPYWRSAAGAYLSAHPHNVQLAQDTSTSKEA